jgi:hypothetical protein
MCLVSPRMRIAIVNDNFPPNLTASDGQARRAVGRSQ